MIDLSFSSRVAESPLRYRPPVCIMEVAGRSYKVALFQSTSDVVLSLGERQELIARVSQVIHRRLSRREPCDAGYFDLQRREGSTLSGRVKLISTTPFKEMEVLLESGIVRHHGQPIVEAQRHIFSFVSRDELSMVSLPFHETYAIWELNARAHPILSELLKRVETRWKAVLEQAANAEERAILMLSYLMEIRHQNHFLQYDKAFTLLMIKGRIRLGHIDHEHVKVLYHQHHQLIYAGDRFEDNGKQIRYFDLFAFRHPRDVAISRVIFDTIPYNLIYDREILNLLSTYTPSVLVDASFFSLESVYAPSFSKPRHRRYRRDDRLTWLASDTERLLSKEQIQKALMGDTIRAKISKENFTGLSRDAQFKICCHNPALCTLFSLESQIREILLAYFSVHQHHMYEIGESESISSLIKQFKNPYFPDEDSEFWRAALLLGNADLLRNSSLIPKRYRNDSILMRQALQQQLVRCCYSYNEYNHALEFIEKAGIDPATFSVAPPVKDWEEKVRTEEEKNRALYFENLLLLRHKEGEKDRVKAELISILTNPDFLKRVEEGEEEEYDFAWSQVTSSDKEIAKIYLLYCLPKLYRSIRPINPFYFEDDDLSSLVLERFSPYQIAEFLFSTSDSVLLGEPAKMLLRKLVSRDGIIYHRLRLSSSFFSSTGLKIFEDEELTKMAILENPLVVKVLYKLSAENAKIAVEKDPRAFHYLSAELQATFRKRERE